MDVTFSPSGEFFASVGSDEQVWWAFIGMKVMTLMQNRNN